MVSKPRNKRTEASAPMEPRRSSQPRAPRRERGVQRYRELIDALETLLETHHADDVGLYQIAEQAGARPASAYHFFPTREAAFFALAERYLGGFAQGLHRPVMAEAFTSWLDLLAYDSRKSVEYFQQHPAALKLLIGRAGGQRVRELDVRHNRSVGKVYVSRIQAAFELPDIPDAASKFHTMLEIQDAIWAISFVKHGTITQEYADEAIRACRAYIRLYYPEVVRLRDEVSVLIAGGQRLIMPQGWQPRPEEEDETEDA
ncbi:MAG: TetR/AcrR family transcriptional regulator [Proteobacteria bacterium]|nr:TetR/AcrR family transcriptional regulator [Pseudomonadota bacterium]